MTRRLPALIGKHGRGFKRAFLRRRLIAGEGPGQRPGLVAVDGQNLPAVRAAPAQSLDGQSLGGQALDGQALDLTQAVWGLKLEY